MTTAVALALYNGSRFIEKQLDSIRLQTKQPDCVVLCDDGSKDDTVAVVREYICRHQLEKTWHLYSNPQNLGYIRNFYKAISLCEADVVFMSDQDDLWSKDKIEKMTQVMEQRMDISLLSCKYGIIDTEDKEIHSILTEKTVQDGTLKEIFVDDIMRAYRWPGMVMCIRKSFFNELYEKIDGCEVAHDLMFAVQAADQGSFFEYHYVGAFHRRHDNNAAREEHRISKLLNLKRKLRDIDDSVGLWRNLLTEDISLSEETRKVVAEGLALREYRRDVLQKKSFRGVLKLYLYDGRKVLRLSSFLCDAWLALFGKE